MESISLFIAFAGGVVSFLAPCVLPLVPGYLAYLAGASATRRETFINSIFFVLGFSLVFAALGVALNTVLSAVAYDTQMWLSRLGGVLIIFFGIYLTGLLKISWLEQDYKLQVRTRFSSRYLTSLLFGAAFAVGWTPCVGAALGAILALAATQPGRAFTLLFAYSLGLGIPFLLVGLFAAQASAFINRFAGALKWVNAVFGLALVALGVLVFTQSLSLIANWSLLNTVLLQ